MSTSMSQDELAMAATDSSESRPGPVGVWLAAARPATLLAGVAPVVLGVGFALYDGVFAALPAFFALLVAVFIQIGTNFTNDYFDFKKGADTEKRLGPARATQRGWLTPRQVGAAAALTFALAFGAGLVLVASAGWPLLAVGIASILSGYAYTGGPFPLAYNGLGDIFVLVFFGPVAVVGTWYVQAVEHGIGMGNALPVVLASLTVGLLATAILAVNNLRDRFTDAEAHKRTLVVRFGERFGIFEHTICIVVPFLLVIGGVAATLFPLSSLLILLATPLAVVELKGVRAVDGAALNKHLGGAAKLTGIFALLFALGLSLWQLIG